MRKLISRGTAMLAATAAVFAGLTVATAGAAEASVQGIKNVGSRSGCWDLTSYSSGTPVSLYECNGGVSQRWNTPGDYTIQSASGLCMDVSSYTAGAVVHMRPCHFGTSQLWGWDADSRVVSFGNRNMCMDLRSYANRTPVTLAPCSSVDSQKWVIY